MGSLIGKKDMIYRQAAIDILYDFAGCIVDTPNGYYHKAYKAYKHKLETLPPAEPEIIRCNDCKHNPKDSWFGCPMSHLNERQRPEDAWCWKGERREE